MNLFDFSDDAGAVLSRGLAEPVVDAALVAHLGADAVFLGQFAKPARFVNRARERLLRIDVLAGLDRRGGNDRVHVVGRADGDRVDLVHHFRVHIAVVDERLGVFEFLMLALERVCIDVAKRDDLAVVARMGNVAAALAADADAGDRNRFESGRARLLTEVAGSDQKPRARYRGRLNEIAA